MKCLKQPAMLQNKPAKIAEVWEVHLTRALFAAIRAEAHRRKCRYSAITRFCIFHLAERSGLRAVPYFHKILREQRQALSQEKMRHRHMVCLYGEDAKLLRLAAIRMGITVSAFIRLALALYLPRVAMEIRSKRAVSVYEFASKSIKRWKTIPVVAINKCNLPHVRRFLFSGFPPEERWGALLWNSIAEEAA